MYELLSWANKITEHRIEIGKLRTDKVLSFFKNFLLLYIRISQALLHVVCICKLYLIESKPYFIHITQINKFTLAMVTTGNFPNTTELALYS